MNNNTIRNISKLDFYVNDFFTQLDTKCFFECEELNKILHSDFSDDGFESIIFNALKDLGDVI